MKKQHIERNEKGEIISWYGFIPAEDVSEKKCYISVFWPDVDLYINDECKHTVDCSEMQWANSDAKKVIYTLGDIWNHIYKECRKITTRKIYISECDMDWLAAGDRYTFMSDSEIETDLYFMEKEENRDPDHGYEV